MTDLLQPVQRVDPAQLLREQWETAVQGVDLMKIVGFVRESPTPSRGGGAARACSNWADTTPGLARGPRAESVTPVAFRTSCGKMAGLRAAIESY